MYLKYPPLSAKQRKVFFGRQHENIRSCLNHKCLTINSNLQIDITINDPLNIEYCNSVPISQNHYD